MTWFWNTNARGVALAMTLLPHITQAQDLMSIPLDPATMKRVGTIDDRFQSYNVEMLEVTGGKFWKPYEGKAGSAHQQKQPAAGAGGGGTRPRAWPRTPTPTARRSTSPTPAAVSWPRPWGRPTCG